MEENSLARKNKGGLADPDGVFSKSKYSLYRETSFTEEISYYFIIMI